MSETRALYQEGGEGGVRCRLCPNACLIREGEAGRCRVRVNRDGILYADSYGRISSIALDPVEKKPLRRFNPGTSILSVGLWGCNLSCRFCQNHEISQHGPSGRQMDCARLVDMALDARSSGNIGLAYTYNEPLVNIEYVLDCAKTARKAGLLNVLVTNGYVQAEPLAELIPFIDAVNIDLKAYTDGFYQNLCGGTLNPVLDAIRYCVNRTHVEITTLIIPGHNDTIEEIGTIASFLSSLSPYIPLHITRHHPAWKMREEKSASADAIRALVSRAEKELAYVYAGNISL